MYHTLPIFVEFVVLLTDKDKVTRRKEKDLLSYEKCRSCGNNTNLLNTVGSGALIGQWIFSV